MPYSNITVEGNWPDHFVRLDSGDDIGLVCTITRAANTQDIVLSITARWVAADGSTKADANGHPVVTQFTHRTSDVEMSANGGIDGVVKQTLMLALGEPSTIAVSNEYKANVSIRRAIASAAATGGPSLGSIL